MNIIIDSIILNNSSRLLNEIDISDFYETEFTAQQNRSNTAIK